MIGLDCTELMKRVLLTIPALVIVIGMYLAILLVLVRVTLVIGGISTVVLRAAAGCGELVLGMVLLLGGTSIATRMAVWIFRPIELARGIERAEIPS
jgi:hypothetical protein